MAQTGFVYHPAYLQHDMGAGHPEAPERLRAILARLESDGLVDRLVRLEPAPADDRWITEIHTASYLADLHARSPASGHVALDPDTALSARTLQAAYLAVGGALVAADAIMAGRADNAFCAVRPPGHHAERERAMGFCFLNTVAIVTRYLQRRHGLERVLIVDWDVHHGNGTQQAFYDDPSVLFFSTHQFPYYPGSGRATEQGEGAGAGYTINVPLPAGQDDGAYRSIFQRVLIPAADAFKPDFLVISAGFDAHRDDPLAGMGLTEDGYADLTGLLTDVAARHCRGRLLSCLEGGYHLEALAGSVQRHVLALMKA